MRVITISAENLLDRTSFVFMKDTPALRAVEIIKEMNISLYPDDKKTLASIYKRSVEVIPAGHATMGKYRLEIILGGKRIYLDPFPLLDFQPTFETSLYFHPEDALYKDPSLDVCVIQ